MPENGGKKIVYPTFVHMPKTFGYGGASRDTILKFKTQRSDVFKIYFPLKRHNLISLLPKLIIISLLLS